MWQLKDEDKLDQDQLLWFMPPGEERLYNLQNDPHQLNNLVNDTAYAGVLNRMRNALDNWLTRIDDWSEIHEDEMVAQFMPEGKQQVTPNPKISIQHNLVSISCTEKGASIGYRINDGHWHLYTKPFAVPGDAQITAKAVRYGWKESKEVNPN
jgi:hypothetical protein